MQDIVNVLVQNGLGVASFLALIFFMSTSLKDMNETMKQMSTTLTQIQTNLTQLNERVNDIESREKK